METETALCGFVLAKDNYVDWSAQVKIRLMAYGLWDIVEGTIEPPNQIDNEAAFEDWAKKNSMALQVIQNSCGPETFPDIREIDSAKSAWDTLAQNYNVLTDANSGKLEMETEIELCGFVLVKDNYADWSAQVKTYLMAYGLWDVVEGTIEPPNQIDNEAAFEDWAKKNSMALQVIQNLCGSETFPDIREINSAKSAWDTLAQNYNVPTNANSENIWNDSYLAFVDLHKAVRSGDWNAAKEIIKHRPNAINAKITYKGQTALQVATARGHVHIVQGMVELMSVESLDIQDNYGYTALTEAVMRGNYRLAECLLSKSKNLINITNILGNLPVVMAIYHGQIHTARYLYALTPLEELVPEKGGNGAKLLTHAIYTGTLDIAFDLIERCPRLALSPDPDGNSPLWALACMPHAFPSGNRLVFWKRWIYEYCIHIEPVRALDETRLKISKAEKHYSDQVKTIKSVPTLLRRLVSNVANYLGIKHLYEMKLFHVQCHELLRRMCDGLSNLNLQQRQDGLIYGSMNRAVKNGIFEVVSEMLRADPDLEWTYDEKKRTLPALAILYRQAKIFNLILGLDVKNALTFSRDSEKNGMLHMAGMSADSTTLNRIPGAALQMQRELQWFKEVEGIVHPKVKEFTNKNGLTARELFTKNHKDMMEKGEKWMKDTATSCTVVGALIITIMFAAAFTVPGGNDQNTGLPIFSNKKVFMLFIICDALSLFSSSTSVLMFLGILASRYAEDDFLESLPRKMIIGLSILFFSIATMMIAFSAGILIMLPRQSWIVNPVICLACVPVILFLFIQFPLLRDMLKSTYGRGIFAGKMKPLI